MVRYYHCREWRLTMRSFCNINKKQLLCITLVGIILISATPLLGNLQYHSTRDNLFQSKIADTSLLKSDDLLVDVTFDFAGYQVPYELVETTTGDYIFTGYSSHETGTNDVWLAKLNPSGGMIWNRTFDRGSADVGNALLETDDGGFLIAAYTSNGPSYNDIWLIRTDSQGQHLWNRTYGTQYYDYSDDILEATFQAEYEIDTIGSTSFVSILLYLFD